MDLFEYPSPFPLDLRLCRQNLRAKVEDITEDLEGTVSPDEANPFAPESYE